MARIRDFLDQSPPMLERVQIPDFDQRVLNLFAPERGATSHEGTWRHSESSFWRAYCYLWRHPPSQAFPEEVTRAARYVVHGLSRGLLEESPGPRGGIGWQVSRRWLEAESQQRHQQQRQAEKVREKVQTLTSRVGTVTLDETEYWVKVTYPELDLLGHSYVDRHGTRLLTTADILRHYFRRKRYRRLEPAGLCDFRGKWQDWKTVQKAIDDLDTRMMEAITKAISISEPMLAELKAIVAKQEGVQDHV